MNLKHSGAKRRKLNSIKIILIASALLLIAVVGIKLASPINKVQTPKIKTVEAAQSPQPMNDYVEIDAEQDGDIYGDLDGLQRVEKLEQQLHNMQIRQDHPRLFITQETLPKYRQRALQENHPAWQGILNRADSGDMANAAFAYQILKESDPTLAQHYADIAIQAMKNVDGATNYWTYISMGDSLYNLEIHQSGGYMVIDQWHGVGEMALAFDWVYDALSDSDRALLIEKLVNLSDIDDVYTGVVQEGRARADDLGHSIHREEWIYQNWQMWPEIVLAHHYDKAEPLYKARWDYKQIFGDAARYYAYLADGSPLEGYYIGSDGGAIFLALKSATGINLYDGELGWVKKAADYLLYTTDPEKGRQVLRRGVTGSAGGFMLSFQDVHQGYGGLIANMFLRTLPFVAEENPYAQWLINHKLNWTGKYASGSIFADEYLSSAEIPELRDIAQLMYYNPNAPEKAPEEITYADMPYGKHFEGSGEVFMRTGFSGSDTVVKFLAGRHIVTHIPLETNTFVLYRKGALAPDSGIYDNGPVQSKYANWYPYASLTVAHNNILVIDPDRPDYPITTTGYVYPGGIDYVLSWNFGRGGYDLLHQPKAHIAKIVDFETTPEYDYAVGESATAYGDRVNEYYRSTLFLRKGDKAYFIVFDRVEATEPNYQKKWLLHLVGKPEINGSMISQEVPGHIESFNGDYLVSENAYGDAALYLKTLLPQKHIIRRVGGQGYRFYVEHTNPKNHAPSEDALNDALETMDAKEAEVGEWRIELIPNQQQARDYFLNVMYLGDVGETMAPVQLVEEGDYVGAIIGDPELINNKILFTKTGTPDYIVTSAESPKPNLTLTKSALVNGEPATEASSGDIITYTITYQNTGDGEARNVVITDPIPEGTTYQTGSAEFASGATGAIDDSTSTIKWTIPSVPAGEGGSVEFEVRVE